MFGKIFWKKCLEKFFGKNVWKNFLEKFFGKNVWKNFLEKFFGKNVLSLSRYTQSTPGLYFKKALNFQKLKYLSNINLLSGVIIEFCFSLRSVNYKWKLYVKYCKNCAQAYH